MEQKHVLQTSLENANYERLVCPVCGFDYIHIRSISVATGLNTITIGHHGTFITNSPTSESEKASLYRGVRVILEYICESRHHGKIILQFHKGNVIVEHERLEDIDLTDPNLEWDIWRC
jgi:hypothetical protein